MNASDPQPVAPQPVSPAKRWLIATRPFSFPASVMPVLFGTALAATVGGAAFQPIPFALALLAMVCLHAGANILGDISDFRRGLDKVPTPVSGAIVRGLMTPKTALAGAVTLIAAGSLMGLILVIRTGPALLWIGIVGVAIGVFYTLPPFALKYRALGDFAVFLDFGILGALGAWTVQTHALSWVPALWAIPIGMLVIGILHANNWRDREGDRTGGFATVAALLGDTGSLRYYGFLVFGAIAFVPLALLVSRAAGLGPALPWASALVVLATPKALNLWSKALRRHNPAAPFDFIALDGATAQFNIVFGLLYIAGILLGAILP